MSVMNNMMAVSARSNDLQIIYLTPLSYLTALAPVLHNALEVE